MRDQDEGIDALAQSIARQKQLAMGINSELDSQNIMLDDLNQGLDSTGSKLKRETAHVTYISEKTKVHVFYRLFVTSFHQIQLHYISQAIIISSLNFHALFRLIFRSSHFFCILPLMHYYKTTGMMCCICLLILVIILVGAIPF